MQQTQSGSRGFLSKRLSVRLFCLLAVVLVGIVGKAHFFAAPPKAYPLLSTAGWAAGDSRYTYFRSYAWLANGDLAHLERDSQGRLQVCYQRMDGTIPSGGVRRGPLLLPTASPLRIFPSPDEQWVAYIEFTGQQKIQTILISADGKTVRTVRPTDERFAVWLPDSRSFLTICPVPNFVVTVHHLDSLRTETIAKTAAGADSIPMSTLITGADFLIGGRYDAVGTMNAPSPNYPNMTLQSFRTSQPDVVQQTWRIPVPTETEIGAGYVFPRQQTDTLDYLRREAFRVHPVDH